MADPARVTSPEQLIPLADAPGKLPEDMKGFLAAYCVPREHGCLPSQL